MNINVTSNMNIQSQQQSLTKKRMTRSLNLSRGHPLHPLSMKHLQSRILTGVVIVVQQKESIGGQVPGVNAHFASKFVPNLFFFIICLSYISYSKHGCDYKGYGFACKLPRLDLTEYLKEPLAKRTRPILQLYCSVCQKKESWQNNRLIFCDGCPKSFHQQCFHNEISSSVLESDESWYCTDACSENITRKRVVIELSRKRLPLMRTPKNALLQSTSL